MTLSLFYCTGSTVVGAFIALSLLLATAQGKTTANKIHYIMTALWVLMAIGFIASTTHLGSPERAFNALNRVGASDLSNEIATGSLFFALGGAYWALAVSRYLQKDRPNLPLVSLVLSIENKLPTAWQPLGRVVVAISGLIFIGAMAKLYLIPTVPTWNSVYTPVSFFLTAVLAGSALTVGLLQAVRCGENLQKAFVSIAIVGAIAAAISTYLNYQYLTGVKTAIFAALDLVPDYLSITFIRFGLIVVGIILLLVALKKRTALISFSGFALILIGELLGRTLFYGLHMTVGLKALGG
ncbi:DmsC/YnfH family molybdoenzyme membrane anchor subunit [Glaesserella parasuis]|nr:DmsC/YnfH family molybdoenzyme membrane anchor subunit [Glaesserella parasuis]MDG6247997.1 dimethyl sulfoxide reductase anchor subunit [Glaesserella parasuis]MDG6456473.1 dimethyl sulfoxide reductase anchor subunit [Glaesserella parasuis]MDG6788848.1 dimethyl sulfoxide reductase anchor subunit [Glaesserella parasuis]MDG6806615.1 dimethyl sulfoxide reductase anchor subunit [Glaesserella parasuis]MDP0207148.1 DmsC/YnfH family molybdoenzyme membrane anchor subunit [Glaesserella parasuis]